MNGHDSNHRLRHHFRRLPMSITRLIFLRASRSAWLADQFRRRRFARRAVRRFLPGETMSAALEATEEFSAAGMGTVITHLGEQVRTPAEVDAVAEHYMRLIGEIERRQLPAQISVKPVSYTHLRAHETDSYLVCRLLLEKKKKQT